VPKDKALYKKMKRNNEKRSALIRQLLELFLERCNCWHSLAFFQHRRNKEGAKLEELEEIFEDRRNTMLVVLKKVGEIMKTKMLKGSKTDIILKGELNEEDILHEASIFLQPKAQLQLEATKKSEERMRIDYILGAAHRSYIN